MMKTPLSIPRCAHTRGFAGIALLGVLMALAIVLFLYFGSTNGKKSYVETVVEAKKQGEDVAMGMQAHDLATNIAAYTLSNNDKLPTTWEELGTPASSYPDRWGHPMRFRVDEQARVVILISNGPDELPDTEDDIEAKAPLQF